MLSILVIIVAIILIVIIVKNDQKRQLISMGVQIDPNTQLGLTIGALVLIIIIGIVTMFVLNYINTRELSPDRLLRSVLRESGFAPKRFD